MFTIMSALGEYRCLPRFCDICDKFPADLVTFTEEILNEKLHFLCSVT